MERESAVGYAGSPSEDSAVSLMEQSLSGHSISPADSLSLTPESTMLLGTVKIQKAGAHTDNENRVIFWNSVWVSTTFLAFVSFLLAILVVATILVWRLSDESHGFALIPTNHYAWTYGPTAILVIITSLWYQIEYWCKLLQPWQQMKEEAVSATESVLLDYVSPIITTNLWRAGRRKHMPVLLALAGGLLLRLVTVASTGFLAPTNTPMPFQNTTLEALTAFNGSDYEDSWNSLTESAANYAAYALLAENLKFPDGLQPGLAYQTFRLPENSSSICNGSIIRAISDIFVPKIQCSSAQVLPTNISSSPETDSFLNEYATRIIIDGTVSWSSCPLSKLDPSDIEQYFYHGLPPHIPNRQIYGSIHQIDCEADEKYVAVVPVFDVRYNQTSVPGAVLRMDNQDTNDTWGIQIMPVTAISCTAEYGVKRAEVSYDHTFNPPRIQVDTTSITNESRLMDGFSNMNFSQRLFTESDDATLLAGNFLSNAMDLDSPNTFLKLMSLIDDSTYEDFLNNPSRMQGAAAAVFEYIAVQVASGYLIKETSLPLAGQISLPSVRLKVSLLSLYLMLSGLLLTFIAGVVLLFIRPKNVVPCNVGNIGGTAMVLSKSTKFQGKLRGMGRANSDDMNKALQEYTFTSKALTSTSGPFGPFAIYINRIFPGEPPPTPGAKQYPSTCWWQPLALDPRAFLGISTLPIALIITLEVLQHLSGRLEGIAIVNDPRSLLVTFGTRIVPSLVFVIISSLYDSVAFNMMLFAPFYRLQRSELKATNIINESLLGKFILDSLQSAIRRKHWAAALAIFASFIGSFLTIIVSGLFVVETLPGLASVNVRSANQFDPAWPNSVRDDGGAAVLLSSFEMLNLSYPALTNAELALPNLRLAPADITKIEATQDSSISLRVPAMRADLSCTVVDVKEQNIVFPGPYAPWDLGINGSVRLPPECDSPSPSVQWSILEDFLSVDDPDNLIAQMQDLHVKANDILSSGERNLTFQEDNPPGCPSLAFTFGQWVVNDTGAFAAPENFTTMACSQLMTEIQVDATLSVPDLNVISAIPDESSVEYLASGPDGSTEFPYRPQAHLNLELTLWEGNFSYGGFSSPGILTDYRNENYAIDGFFSLMLNSGDGPKPDELMGQKNSDRLITEIRKVYRRYMAQVISAKMRVPMNATSSGASFTATWTDSNRGVLRQSVASKIALQVFLAAMFVSGIAAYFLIDTKRVLPQNPCSIAGLASLLVDSALCQDQFSEEMKEGTKRGKTNGLIVSLGWWDGPGGRRRYGIDVGRAHREETDSRDDV